MNPAEADREVRMMQATNLHEMRLERPAQRIGQHHPPVLLPFSPPHGDLSPLAAVLRQFFAGFWFHPVGLLIGPTHMMDQVWGSCLVALALRFAVVRMAGAEAVRARLLPAGIGVFFEARNLTDANYSAAVATDDANRRFFFPGDGRSFYGGLSWKWR